MERSNNKMIDEMEEGSKTSSTCKIDGLITKIFVKEEIGRGCCDWKSLKEKLQKGSL